jgi:hypothetical protein
VVAIGSMVVAEEGEAATLVTRAFRAPRERHGSLPALRAAETAVCKTRRYEILPHLDKTSIVTTSRATLQVLTITRTV